MCSLELMGYLNIFFLGRKTFVNEVKIQTRCTCTIVSEMLDLYSTGLE